MATWNVPCASSRKRSRTLLLELRERETYQKPTTRRKMKKGAAKSRWRKFLRSQQLPPRLY